MPVDEDSEETQPGRPVRSGPDVLLIESEDPLRALLRRIVESAGYVAVEARSAEEAIALLAGTARTVRLVLADLAEPGVAGSQGIRKNIARGMKLLLLSTANYERSEARDLDGVAFYLSNPFRADALAERIRGLLEEA
jgi:two-component system cell cycle sensor histidine kinase/response regulator CckA